MAYLYTARPSGLLPGIAQDGPDTLLLGEKGRARVQIQVPHTAGAAPTATLERRRSGLSLSTGPGGSAVLVRVKTRHMYTRGCPGSIRAAVGCGWEIVAEGRAAFGDAGGLGAAPDALLLATRMAVAHVTFSGGFYKGGGGRWLIAVPEEEISTMPGQGEPFRVAIVDTSAPAGTHLHPGTLLTPRQCGAVARILGSRSWDQGFTAQAREVFEELADESVETF